MTASSSGAVFFLGTRAHYQVLQQPENRFDIENGNSTETIYEKPSIQVWNEQDMDSSGDYGDKNWSYCDNDGPVTEEKDQLEMEPSTGIKKRVKRHSSETELCERDGEMRPALLNYLDSNTQKSKPSRRVSLLTFLTSLARRKRRLETDQIQYLKHLESALTSCTYRESCRCLECQSRYFDCDDSDYSSDESVGYVDYTRYAPPPPPPREESDDDDDDEVFIDKVPEDNTSTDLLIEGREKPTHMSVSSDEVTETLDEDALEIEVAAGTPVLLNYLLTHPITCNIM